MSSVVLDLEIVTIFVRPSTPKIVSPFSAGVSP